MQNDNAKPIAGFDGHIHFRAPSDLMPNIHVHARRRGLTAASWLRSIIIEALDREASTRKAA